MTTTTPKTFFLVDDDPIYQAVTKKIISKTQCPQTITSFSNGMDALENLKNTSNVAEILPDIILLDLDMPVMDGWDFLENFNRLKNTFQKDILVYIVSSSIAQSDQEKAKTYPTISGYISKPLTREDIKKITT